MASKIYDEEDPWRDGPETISHQRKDLFRAAIPVMRLSRIYYNKLARQMNDDVRLIFSDSSMHMGMDQLKRLFKETNQTVTALTEFIYNIRENASRENFIVWSNGSSIALDLLRQSYKTIGSRYCRGITLAVLFEVPHPPSRTQFSREMADFDTLDSEHQGVILGFENLASKYHQVIGQKPALKTPDSETRSLIKLIDSKKDSLNRLYTHSLPLVRQQIERLLGILVRIDLDEESESQLKLVFELQPKLEHALDNLWSIREVTFLEESLNFNLPDNPDLLYHEECCLADLDNIKNNILPMIVDCFRKSCDLIKQTKFSSETAKDHNVLDSAKTSVIELRDRIYNEISETMDTLRESDFDASDRVIAYTSCLLQDFMIMKAQNLSRFRVNRPERSTQPH
ncbi:hypothetical protein H4Q26_009471 [Puccinia striiformis f. sp. tritici PST-130]|nr:hypothetical protein H4Q26_009471 [Puccinia striiformis f. sp. tritici PST-130]